MTLRVFLFLFPLFFALSAHAESRSCRALFEPYKSSSRIQSNHKKLILEEALDHARIKLTLDQKEIDRILKNWDIEVSTDVKVEALSQALVVENNTFFSWIKNRFKKLIFREDLAKEALRLRAQTLMLKREFLDALEVRGLLKKNTRADRRHAFLERHFNKIVALRMLAINYASIFLIGFPIDIFPNFHLIKNLDLKEKDLDRIQHRGFDNVYPELLENYRRELRLHNITAYTPYALFLGTLTYIGYNYLHFTSETTRFEGHVEEVTIPQSHHVFLEWKKSYEEEMHRKVDMRNPQDQKDWDFLVQSIYGGWAANFKASEGRSPDLSKTEDRQEWEKFLSRVQF